MPIARQFLSLAAPAAVVGVLLSATLIAPSVKATEVRVYFSVLMTSVAIAIIIQDIRKIHGRNQRLTRFGGPSRPSPWRPAWSAACSAG